MFVATQWGTTLRNDSFFYLVLNFSFNKMFYLVFTQFDAHKKGKSDSF
jgi:hypothetical protein